MSKYSSALTLMPKDNDIIRAILERIATLEAKATKIDAMETRLSQCECNLSVRPFLTHPPNLASQRRPVNPRPSQSRRQTPYPIASSILEIISRAGVPVEPAGVRIAETVERHFRDFNRPITTLRAKPFRALGGQLWPVVEWKQGEETDAFAIFTVENTRLPLSHIMHFGDGMVYQSEGNSFKKSSLQFQVANLPDLGKILRATQCVLNVPWSKPDMLTDYPLQEYTEER